MPSAQHISKASSLGFNRSSFRLFLIPCTEFTKSTYSGAKSGPSAGTFVDVAPLGAHCVKLAAQFWRGASFGDAKEGGSSDARKTQVKNDVIVKGMANESDVASVKKRMKRQILLTERIQE